MLNVLIHVRLVLYLAVSYNEEKEQQAQWDAKIKELDRIEEAKKKKAEKKKSSEFLFIILYCLVNLIPI